MTLRLKNEKNYFEYRAGIVAIIKINNCLLIIIIFILSLFKYFQYFDYNVLCLNHPFYRERAMQFTCGKATSTEKKPCFAKKVNICNIVKEMSLLHKVPSFVLFVLFSCI